MRLSDKAGAGRGSDLYQAVYRNGMCDVIPITSGTLINFQDLFTISIPSVCDITRNGTVRSHGNLKFLVLMFAGFILAITLGFANLGSFYPLRGKTDFITLCG
jgi:hypothetical protein